MRKFIRISPVILLVIMLTWAGCATNKVSTVNYAGVYNWSITTDNGDLSGNITLNHSGDTYTGTIASDQGSQDLTNLKIDGNNITANFSYMSYDVTMKGVIDDHDIKGTFSAEGYDFPFDAKKQEK